VGHRAGGMFAMSTAAHAITQQWALAIVEAFGYLDDVGDHSGFAADPSVALVTAADSALPMPPGVSVPLTHPGRLDSRRAAAAGRFGYRIT
jgi:hypothetical protein